MEWRNLTPLSQDMQVSSGKGLEGRTMGNIGGDGVSWKPQKEGNGKSPLRQC